MTDKITPCLWYDLGQAKKPLSSMSPSACPTAASTGW